MANIDFAVEKGEDGLFDLVIEDGTIKETNLFDTSILLSFFEERRADSSEVLLNFLRRGWWGSTLLEDDFEFGSKMWLLEQARLTTDILNKAISYARECFQWFIDENLLDDIEVTGELLDDRIVLTIRFFRDSNVIATATFQRWEDTTQFSSLIEFT